MENNETQILTQRIVSLIHLMVLWMVLMPERALLEAWLCSLLEASAASWVLLMPEIKKLIITGDKNEHLFYT